MALANISEKEFYTTAACVLSLTLHVTVYCNVNKLSFWSCSFFFSHTHDTILHTHHISFFAIYFSIRNTNIHTPHSSPPKKPNKKTKNTNQPTTKTNTPCYWNSYQWKTQTEHRKMNRHNGWSVVIHVASSTLVTVGQGTVDHNPSRSSGRHGFLYFFWGLQQQRMIYLFIYWRLILSPINHTGSPHGFLLVSLTQFTFFFKCTQTHINSKNSIFNTALAYK